MNKIVIGDVKKFVGPLKQLTSSVNSIAFTKVTDTLAFAVNAISTDRTQITNLVYKPETIKLVEGTVDKFGIYNLAEFVSVLTLFSDINTLTLTIEGNYLTIGYNDKSRMNYILSDLALIKEGTAEPKSAINFISEFNVDVSFIRKVKAIASAIGVDTIRVEGKAGKLFFTILKNSKNSHTFHEEIGDSNHEFKVDVVIRDEKRENFSLLYDQYPYTLGIHSKVIQFKAITDDYQLLRYFIAPTDK